MKRGKLIPVHSLSINKMITFISTDFGDLPREINCSRCLSFLAAQFFLDEDFSQEGLIHLPGQCLH